MKNKKVIFLSIFYILALIWAFYISREKSCWSPCHPHQICTVVSSLKLTVQMVVVIFIVSWVVASFLSFFICLVKPKQRKTLFLNSLFLLSTILFFLLTCQVSMNKVIKSGICGGGKAYDRTEIDYFHR